MTAPVPLINGHRYSFASVEVAAIIGGRKAQIFPDIYNIKYNDKLNISYVRGTSRVPIGSTAGTWEGEASILIGKSSATAMKLIAGPGWLGVSFNIIVSYADVGEIFTLDTLSCRISGCDDDHSEGPDGLQSLITLFPLAPTSTNGIQAIVTNPF